MSSHEKWKIRRGVSVYSVISMTNIPPKTANELVEFGRNGPRFRVSEELVKPPQTILVNGVFLL